MFQNISKNKMPIFFGLLLLFISLFLIGTNFALANQGGTGWDSNLGGSDATAWGEQAENIQERSGLGNDDPRNIIANLINIALGFLGIIAVCIIIYAGFLWMTSQGNPDKINDARKILIGGIIGLIIILSSFALAAFVMDMVFRATTDNFGTGSNGTLSTGGTSQPTGVGGPGNNQSPLACSSSVGECSPDESICDELGPYWSCNTDSCLCQVENLGSCYNSRDDICNYPCSAGLGCFGLSGCENNTDTNPCGQGDDTCACCCSLSDDNCSLIYPSLECRETPGDCSGGDRGKCCGCEADNQCGENINAVGCGSDTCCHNRPTVLSVVPANNSSNICTNALVSIEFSVAMNSRSFYDNMFVVGEFVGASCPEGTSLFSPSSNQVNIPTQAGANYCRVNGSYYPRNSQEGNYVDFVASQIYETDTRYYIYLKSGETNSEGDSLEGGVESFYGLSLADEYISNFRTIDDSDGNDGICVIEQVTLSPPSYLFRDGQNSVREVDDDAGDDTFDSERDSDKLFVAQALSPDRQVLASMPGYQWDWEIESSVTSVVRLVDNANIENMRDTMRLAQVVPGVTDGRTYIRATIEMSAYSNTTNEGDGLYDRSRVWVFICNNPWPPFETGSEWAPWSSSSLGTNPDYNYEVYYCRDIGRSGTADDLPAFDSVGTASSPETEVLQQVYFTYQAPPPPGSILPASAPVSDLNYPNGETVYLEWSGVPGVAGYKTYWSQRSGQYRQSQDVGLVNSYYIEGLENGETYYFSVTAYSDENAESSYFEEVSLMPQDTTAPTSTPIFNDPATFTIESDRIILSWSEAPGVDSYELSYGLSPGMYGVFVDLGLDRELIVKELSPNTEYYFAIRSVDQAGNVSENSDTVNLRTVEE